MIPYKYLYESLQPTKEHRIPSFYGLPKIHKALCENGLPPLRPIVSHLNSLLSASASFIDHSLQPLACAFPDFLQNSTELIRELENLTIPVDAVLITLDVINLFPSIPQKECLDVIHKAMFKHTELIIFDPNLITRLLAVNMSNNFFQFSNAIFLQKEGTAMGSACSPAIANIFISTLLGNFLSSVTEKPFFMKRYIDDIFIIWPKHQDFNAFFKSLNSFHPNIKFTTSQSENSINFLDLNIYKGSSFQKEKKLDVSTYQKTNNLYQYLHFHSNHPNHGKNGLIIGEAIRYVRTNSTQCEYLKQIGKFTQRLMSRGYPKRFIEKALKKVDYQRRPCYLQQNISPPKVHIFHGPIFECIPPPRFQYLKNIILHGLKQLDMDLHPLFVTKKHVTIKDVIVKARHSPTEADSYENKCTV